MAFFRTTNLSASDHNDMRHERGLMKVTPTRVSKQHLVEAKMFGKKRKGIQFGKTFKKQGKGISLKGYKPKMENASKGISPSLEEFDKMMHSIVKGSKGSKGSSFTKRFVD